MRKYALLLAMAFIAVSCQDKTGDNDRGSVTGDKEVELRVIQRSARSRATVVPFPSAGGTAEEKTILTLDLIAFDADTKEFVYTRPGNPTASGTFRASVPLEHPRVDVAVLANCPASLLTNALASSAWGASAKSWEDLQLQLIDMDPTRLINPSTFSPLPMSSTAILTNKSLVSTGITDWGEVELMRSVASIDLLMERNTATSKLELAHVHTYYAANKGYFATMEKPEADPQQYEIPTDMVTNLNSMKASRIGETQTGTDPEEAVIYDAVTSQLYLYDNSTTTFTPGNSLNSTRVIVEGYYDQAEVTGPKTPTYYPLLLVEDGNYRPIIRNWKYLLVVDAVYGPGYSTIDEAAVSSPINLNVEVVNWNLADVEVGVSGSYYVSINRKQATLGRETGSTSTILINYKGESSDTFGINFKDDTNGAQETIDNAIENQRFRVTLTTNDGNASLLVQALGDYSLTDSENMDTVILTYRNLVFEIAINQIDVDEEDWGDGGSIPWDL